MKYIWVVGLFLGEIVVFLAEHFLFLWRNFFFGETSFGEKLIWHRLTAPVLSPAYLLDPTPSSITFWLHKHVDIDIIGGVKLFVLGVKVFFVGTKLFVCESL